MDASEFLCYTKMVRVRQVANLKICGPLWQTKTNSKFFVSYRERYCTVLSSGRWTVRFIESWCLRAFCWYPIWPEFNGRDCGGDLRMVEAQPPSRRAAEPSSSSCTMKPGGERKRSRDVFLLTSNSHPYKGTAPLGRSVGISHSFLVQPSQTQHTIPSSPS